MIGLGPDPRDAVDQLLRFLPEDPGAHNDLGVLYWG